MVAYLSLGESLMDAINTMFAAIFMSSFVVLVSLIHCYVIECNDEDQ